MVLEKRAVNVPWRGGDDALCYTSSVL